MEKIVEKTVTMTEENYREYLGFFHKKSFGGSYTIFYVCAALFFGLAVLYFFLFDFGGIIVPVIFALAGLYFLLDAFIFVPESIKREAKAAFDNQKPYTVVIYNDRIVDVPLPGREPSYTEINIPIAQLMGAFETEGLLIFTVDPRRAIILPKVLLDDMELDLIRNAVKI